MNENEEEKEVQHPEAWMIRPCVFYKDEHDDCTSIKARFNQYFIFGETLNCDQWKIDYGNCCKWQKTKLEEAYNELIQSEKKRRMERLLPHYQNNVWEKREKPPEDWNAPLPEWMQKQFNDSYLHIKNEEMKSEQEDSVLSRKCIIL